MKTMFIALLLIPLAIGIVHGQVAPANPTQYVLPADATVCGQSQADMSVGWWKYNFSLSTNVAVPSDITNRVYLPAGPYGDCPDVYYLASRGFAPPPLEPIFNIPEDAYIFFPIQSVFWDNIDVIPPLTEKELRDAAGALMDLLLEARMTIDGVLFPNFRDHRQQSPLFSFNFTNPDNIYSLRFIGRPFTGIDDPIVADGYYVLLKLPVGMHVLSVGATFGPPINLSYDLPAYINVVPIALTERVSKLISSVNHSSLLPKRLAPLLASLNAAEASFAGKNLRAGVNQLTAFQSKVRAQVAPNSPALANVFIQSAQRVIEKARQQL